jgi:hypothetical protein
MANQDGSEHSIDPEEAADVQAWLVGQGRTCPQCSASAKFLEAFAIRVGVKPIPDGGLDTSDYHHALIRCTNCRFKDAVLCLEDVGLRPSPRF